MIFLKENDRAQRWGRFLIGGLVNTVLTYALYLALNELIPYQWAYLIAYVMGIIFAYCFNAAIVFRKKLVWKGFFAYPFVYVVQYGLSAAGLWLLVGVFGFSKEVAPLIVIIISMPVTYLLNKILILRTHTV